MDENEISIPIAPRAKKHDRWSVIVLSLNFVGQVMADATEFFDDLTQLALQHKEHKSDEEHFFEIVGE